MPFRVSGGKILDPQGRPWFGQGIAMATNNPLDFTVTNVTRAIQLFPGINFIRASEWNPVRSSPSNWSSVVTLCTNNNIVVWFEDHDNSGNAIYGPGSGDLSNEQNWYGALAQFFNGNDHVWFGTMNEPGWENFGGRPSSPREEDQQITTYHTIRNAGNNCPILFEAGPGSGRSSWNAPVQDYMQGSIYANANLTNIIWDSHFYPWMVQGGTGNITSVQNELATQIRNLQGVAQSADGIIPVITGEFGNATDKVIDDVGGNLVATVLASNLIQGFNAWIWNQNGSGSEIDNLTPGSSGSGAQLGNYGRQVAAGIATHAAATPSQSISINTPSTTVVGTAFPVSGTLGNYSSTPTLNYRDDAGAFGALPAGASVSTTTYSFSHPGSLAAGTHSVTVRDAGNTSVFGVTNNFTISAAPTPITVAAPANVTSGSNFTVTGSLATFSSVPSLQYADDTTGAFVALPAAATVTTTSFSFSHPSLPAGSHTVTVRDANNTGVLGTTPSFIVAAAPTPVAIQTPFTAVVGSPITITGSLNYAAVPTLNYADDSGAFRPLPVGATISTTDFSFSHPSMSGGVHTVTVRDANIAVNSATTSPFTVSPYTYTVSTGPSATGPWTQFGQPVSQPLDKVTGLTAGATYFFQVVTNDVATGLQSVPVITGPVTITASISESPEATRVTASNQSIIASQTPGSASNGPFDTWSITAVGGEVTRNGVADATTAALIELFYHNHTVYQEASNGNGTLTPGWWSWNGSTWIAETSIPPGAP